MQNNSSAAAQDLHSRSLLDEYQFVTLTLLSVGIAANICALATLTSIKIKDVRRKTTFSATSMLILQHQALTDLIVCAITLAFEAYSEEHPSPGEHTLYGPASAPHIINIITCHIWESYALYWTFIFVSTWNMVFLATERLFAVVLPNEYRHLERSAVRVPCFLVLYTVGVLISLTESFSVQYDPTERICLEKRLLRNNDTLWMRQISDSSDITWIGAAFILPALFLILFNSAAVVRYRGHLNSRTVRQRGGKTDSVAESDRQQHRLSLLRSMTITSTAIATIFISTNFWDAYLTMVKIQSGADADYDRNTFEQRFARLLASLNSVCDPFVYYMVLPRVRREISQNVKAVLRLLGCAKPQEL